MTNSELASWCQVGAAILQAFLSAGAVVAAVVIASRSDRNAARTRVEHQRSIARDWAIQLLPNFEAWQQMALKWRTLLNRDSLGEWEALKYASESPVRLSYTEPLQVLNGRYRDLGDAADRVQTLILRDRELDQRTHEFRAVVVAVYEKKDPGESYAEMRELLNNYLTEVSEAADCIRALAYDQHDFGM